MLWISGAEGPSLPSQCHLVLTFPLPVPPSLLFPCHPDFNDKLTLTSLFCLCHTQEGDFPLHLLDFSLLVSQQDRDTVEEWAAQFGNVAVPNTHSAPCANPRSFPAPLPPTVLSHLSLLHFSCTQQSPLAWFPSWKGSRSLILHFLLPHILLSRALLKTLAGRRAEGSSLSPGFLF